MITEAEIRRLAARWQVDPMIPDLDYALSWFLAGLSKTLKARSGLRFKGGTCLRKCYFPGYRFSEDLDLFTLDSEAFDRVPLYFVIVPITVAELEVFFQALAEKLAVGSFPS